MFIISGRANKPASPEDISYITRVVKEQITKGGVTQETANNIYETLSDYGLFVYGVEVLMRSTGVDFLMGR